MQPAGGRQWNSVAHPLPPRFGNDQDSCTPQHPPYSVQSRGEATPEEHAASRLMRAFTRHNSKMFLRMESLKTRGIPPAERRPATGCRSREALILQAIEKPNK